MTNLDLYAKVEHLLDLQEATQALHNLYQSELEGKEIKTLLDVGCGRGDFLEKMMQQGIQCKGVDLSQTMVDVCQKKGLDVHCIDATQVDGEFDAIVSIFDVLNFMDKKKLISFLETMAEKLTDDGILIADINTLYGFSDVAEGTMINENENEFLSVDAHFQNNELHTTFTLFEKETNDMYHKYQDTIIQYFHPIKTFQNLKNLKLVEKQTFSLYDTHDKTLLIFKKKNTH
ncbi:hypothetical protein MNB_SM-3-1504 [hydrothermal vent metagenome]|uniref:Methyltransferase domain-containing protein n=1 Tax=hydrothermal vent metagenome TaxID=652676 RepID=A0A1W1D2P0_9ZZZZ